MAHATRNMIGPMSKRFNGNFKWRRKIDDATHNHYRSVSPDPSGRESGNSNMDAYEDPETEGDQGEESGVEIVQLNCTHSEADCQDLLGLRLAGSRSSGVFVQCIQPGSLAEKLGQIEPYDQLLQVENISLIGLTPDQVVRVLRTALSLACNGAVRLKTAHRWADQRNRQFRPMSPRSLDDMSYHSSETALASGMSSINVDIENSFTSTSNASIEAASYEYLSPKFIVVPKASSSHKLNVAETSRPTGAVKMTHSHTDHAMITKRTANTFATTLVNTPPIALSTNDLRQTAKNFKHSDDQSTVDQSKEKPRQAQEAIGSTQASDRIGNSHSMNSLPGAIVDNSFEGFHLRRRGKPTNSKDLSSAKRKSCNERVNETDVSDCLPLVSFDHLTMAAPSPTQRRHSMQNRSSGQSKSSKGSSESSGRSSQGSQQLSWQCPVCLDGASRIRRTRRRMMSTSCGHVFCNKCVEDVVNKYHLCPTCRASVMSMENVHPIFM